MARPGTGRKQPGGVTKTFTSELPGVDDILKRTKEVKANEETTILNKNANTTAINKEESLATTNETNIEVHIPDTIEHTNNDVNDSIGTSDEDAHPVVLDSTTIDIDTFSTYKEANAEVVNNEVVTDEKEKNTETTQYPNALLKDEEHSVLNDISEEMMKMYQQDPFSALSHKEILSDKEIVYLDVHNLVHADFEKYYNHFRHYTDVEMARLVYSILRDGIIYPLIIYKEKVGRLIVLSGNHRLEAFLIIPQLYGKESWFDTSKYQTIKCIVLEEEDEKGNCVSIDEARRIVIETNIRREDTSEEEIAANLHYEKEILTRETANIPRFPVLQTLADKMSLTKSYVFYMLQIYENLIPELHELYYQKKAFKKNNAILLSKLSPEIQQWMCDKYSSTNRINTKYLSQIDEKAILEKIDNNDIEGIKNCIDVVLGAKIDKKEKLVEIKKKIPSKAKDVVKKTLDEVVTAASNLTEGNTLMAMMCEVPEQLDSDEIRKKCLDAIQKVIEEAKGTSR